MNRTTSTIRLLAAAATMTTMLTGIALAQDLTIRIASVNAPTSESWKGVMASAERVTERTVGRVKFEGFPSGQL